MQSAEEENPLTVSGLKHVKIWYDTRNNIEYINVRSEIPVNAVISVLNKKITITGYPSITIAKGNPVYGPEIQFQLHQKKTEDMPLKVETREVSNYNRVEIDVALETGVEMLGLALKKALETLRELKV